MDKRDEVIEDLLETLSALAAFAVGNDDVCDIIARRARAAVQRAEAKLEKEAFNV